MQNRSYNEIHAPHRRSLQNAHTTSGGGASALTRSWLHSCLTLDPRLHDALSAVSAELSQ